MGSAIDSSRPLDGLPANKADLRLNLDRARSEINHGGFFTPSGTGAVERAVRDCLRERVSAKDFGALGDGSGDTIAEWLSGGTRDRGYADLAAVQADYPKAQNINATIDMVAIQCASDYAVATSQTLWLPPGTYIIDPRFGISGIYGISVDVNDGRSLNVEGTPQSIIKRKDKCVRANNNRMWSARSTSGGARLIRFAGFSVDGNAAQNPAYWVPGETVEAGEYRRISTQAVYVYSVGGVTGGSEPSHTSGSAADGTATADYVDVDIGFLWEHSSSLEISGNAGSLLDLAVFEDLYGTDPVADHFWCTANGQESILTLIYDRITCYNRNRSRGDIQFNNGATRVFISNCDVPTLECESTIDSGGRVCIINVLNTRCRTLDFAYNFPANRDANFVSFVNFYCERTFLAGFMARFVNSTITPVEKDSGRLSKPSSEVIFENCVIRVPLNAAGTAYDGISIQWTLVGPIVVWYRRCRFEVAATGALAFPATAIGEYSAVSVGDTVEHLQIVEDCEFDPRFDVCINHGRNGDLVTRRNRFRGGTAVKIGPTSGHRASWLSEDDDFSGVTSPFEILAQTKPDADARLRLRHSGAPAAQLAWKNVSGTTFLNNFDEVQSTRIGLIAAGPPTGGGIAGDRIRLIVPPVGGVNEWLCTASHPTAATWVPHEAISRQRNITTDDTLQVEDVSGRIRLTGAGDANVTVPANATAAIPIGSLIEVYAAGTGTATLVAAGGVTLNGGTLTASGGQRRLRKVAADEWDVA